jgi:Flp pilus assembly protein TadG
LVMSGLRKFRRDCKGSVALIFAIAIVPLLAAAGCALDFARGVQRREELQMQVDSALLAFSRLAVTQSDADIAAKIRAHILSKGYPPSELGTITVTRNGQTLTAVANGTMPTTLMRVLGINELEIAARVTARWMQAEVVLVLDNSGSMNGTRMSLLKTAVRDFIDTSAGTDGAMKYGMVPFAQSVRVPVTSTYKNAEWIDWGGNVDDSEDGEDGEDGVRGVAIDKSKWNGCIVDRPLPWNVDDTYYSSSKKYPAIQTCSNEQVDIGLVQDLGTSPTDLKAAVSAMGDGGTTNMTIGVAWGHAMLTKQVPFAQTAYTAEQPEKVRRIIILMTDGHNTSSQHSHSEAQNDTWTLQACSAAKTAGIEIYTIGFIGGDADLLSACASSAGNYITAATTADISKVFQTLASAVRRPMLAH